MSINSLANFGVPGLNTDRGPALHQIHKNRWRLSTFNFGTSGETSPYDMSRQAQSITLPELTFETATVYSYVSSVYVPTRGEWAQGTMVFKDDITNSIRGRIENQAAKQQNMFDQTMSRAGENFKFEMDLDILAGGASAGGTANDANIIRKYCYSGCFIVSVSDGEMSYEDATLKDVTVQFRYDNCIVFDQNGVRMGSVSHSEEIQTQAGVSTTGIGSPSGSGVNSTRASVNLGFSGVSLGGATVNGNIGTSGSTFNVSF